MQTVLIVDDDPAIGDLEEEVLGRAGYGVRRAYSGTEALLILRELRPDIVLLDLMLPGLSGEELLPALEGIPVIVVSAKTAVADKVGLLLGGAAAGMIYNTEFIELPEALPLYIAAALLLTAAVAAVLTAAAMLIPNRAFSAVTAVLLAFGLIILGGAIYSALCEPETVSQAIINADGGFGVGEPQPNPRYISGTLREVYGYLMDVLPSGQALLLAGSAFVHPALSLISSAAIMILVSALGAAVFGRKDLK